MSEKVRNEPLSWREALLIPKGFGEREPHARSMRWPKELIERIEKLAGDTQQDFSATVFYLTQWALDEYDRQRAAEKKEKRGA